MPYCNRGYFRGCKCTVAGMHGEFATFADLRTNVSGCLSDGLGENGQFWNKTQAFFGRCRRPQNLTYRYQKLAIFETRYIFQSILCCIYVRIPRVYNPQHFFPHENLRNLPSDFLLSTMLDEWLGENLRNPPGLYLGPKGLYIWSNYSDLTRPHPKWWFSKGNPLISGKPRLVKYNNLARYMI